MSKILMKDAEALVPVGRAALYRHAKCGDLSTSKDAQGRLVVDVAELERYYGKLNGHPEVNGSGGQCETPAIDDLRHLETPEKSSNGHPESGIETQVMIELLREQLADTRSELADAKDRERQLLSLLKTAQETCKMLMAPKEKKRFGWLGYFRWKR